MLQSNMVLIITDEPGFSRSLIERWQRELSAPSFTMMSSDLFSGAAPGAFDLAVLGPVRGGRLGPILGALEGISQPVICTAENSAQMPSIKSQNPRALVIERHSGWEQDIVLLASECLKRIDLVLRLRKSEHAATHSNRNAILGRYILEHRHDLSNLLTSVLGNADLLLMDSDQFPDVSREQIETIHAMALQMHEILQRFSSMAAEMQMTEKVSHPETQNTPDTLLADLTPYS